MGSILFIHGIGVRTPAYQPLFDRIRREAAVHLPGWTLFPCVWGDALGATLRAGGCTVPDYASSRRDVSRAELDKVALWSRLYDDPFAELRLVPAGRVLPPVLPRPDAPSSRTLVRQRLNALSGEDEPSRLLERAGLALVWPAAVEEVAGSEWLAGVNVAGGDAAPAIARAAVAVAVLLGEDRGVPPPDGDARDTLAAWAAAALGGGRSLPGRLGAPFGAAAIRLAVWMAERRKRSLTEAAFPVAGDLLVYQTRGAPIRDFIRARLEGLPRPVVLLAHSLGGVACVDLLVTEPVEGPCTLVTVGSQAPFLYELGCLSSLEFGAPLPTHFPPWLNVYDPQDFLSFLAAPVFGGRVSDFEVRSRQPFPRSHAAYWSSPAFWNRTAEFLA